MPILGVVASGISGHLTGPPSFESIATVTPSGSSTITFSSIPSTYKHLQIRFSAITSAAAGISGTLSGSSTYATHELGVYYGGGSDRVGTNANTGQSAFNYIYGGLGQTMAGTYPTVGIIDILDYASTTKNKVICSFVGANSNSSTLYGLDLSSGLSISTTSVTSITLTVTSGTFSSGSTFALYGIKG